MYRNIRTVRQLTGLRAIPDDVQWAEVKEVAASMTMCLQCVYNVSTMCLQCVYKENKTLKHTKRFVETEVVDYSRIFVFRGWKGDLGSQLPQKAKDECVHNYNIACSSLGYET